MGDHGFSGTVRWSVDGDRYLGSIDYDTPAGPVTLSASIPRAAVFAMASQIRDRLVNTAPPGVDIGAWDDPYDQERFGKIVRQVAHEQLRMKIAQQMRKHGVVTASPWLGEWSLTTADRAYDLIEAAGSGDEVARGQLDAIRRAASRGVPEAVHALEMFNVVARMVANGAPHPSETAAGVDVGRGYIRPVAPTSRKPASRGRFYTAKGRPATPVRPRAVARPAAPAAPAPVPLARIPVRTIAPRAVPPMRPNVVLPTGLPAPSPVPYGYPGGYGPGGGFDSQGFSEPEELPDGDEGMTDETFPEDMDEQNDMAEYPEERIEGDEDDTSGVPDESGATDGPESFPDEGGGEGGQR